MLSVVMAVHNGASTLPLTLDAFAFLEVPAEGAELVIVDNASTDATPEIIRSAELPIPVVHLSEPERGRSRALNRGIRNVSGDVILFTDDDVLPDPRWLCVYSRAARERSDITIFAGQVRHLWQKRPPKWLARLAADGMSYGGTPVGREEGFAQPSEVKGANFAVRAPLLKDCSFPEDVGYGANGQMVAGDETAFLREAVRRGNRIWFLPAARLDHIVRPHEVGILPVLRRYFRIGRGSAVTNPANNPDTAPRIFGYPRFIYRLIPAQLTLALIRLVLFDQYGCTRILIRLALSCGRIYEWRRRNSA